MKQKKVAKKQAKKTVKKMMKKVSKKVVKAAKKPVKKAVTKKKTKVVAAKAVTDSTGVVTMKSVDDPGTATENKGAAMKATLNKETGIVTMVPEEDSE